MLRVRRGRGRARSPQGLCARAVAFAPELLEGRRLLSADTVTVGITPGSTAAGLTYGTVMDEHDGHVMIRTGGTILAPLAGPFPAARPAPAGGEFSIVLNKGPNLLANPLASAAFDQAAAFIESRFSDPITVAFDVDIQPLGGNVLGQASTAIYPFGLDALRTRIINQAAADEAYVSQLPTLGTFLSTMPAGFTLNDMAAARANLLALGVNPAQYPGMTSAFGGVPVDATIIFSSQFPFDYDRSNGINDGFSDFVGVAIHEIAHAMGFTSAVDEVDRLFGVGGTVAPMPLDLFRFAPGAAGAGGINFATARRVLAPGTTVANQVFYDGGIFNPSGITSIPGLLAGEIPLSTGVSRGDGNQASHWKDDFFVGNNNIIGAMDPSASEGEEVEWSAADERALSLIGWDTAPVVVPGRISGMAYHDADGNGAYDLNVGDYGQAGVTIYDDANNNGQFEAGLAQRSPPAQDLPVTIFDLDTVHSDVVVTDLPGTVRDVNVTVNIGHTWTRDLELTLISPGPSPRRVTLFYRHGHPLFGSQDISVTTFDDEAFAPLDDDGAPWNGFYQPFEPLSVMDGAPMNGTWRLEITDHQGDDFGALEDWTLTFTTEDGEASTTSGPDGAYTFDDLAAGTYRLRQVVWDGYRQTQPAANGAHVVNLADGQQVTGRDFGMAIGGAPASSVAGRHLFYNNSKFDGYHGGASAADDAAIAADKVALRPGQASSFANYGSYARGINGIMVDIANLPAGGVTASDFGFYAGNDPSYWNWLSIPVTPTVSVRRGAGVNGSDRVTLTFPDGAITRRWLEVTVRPNANTGLTTQDVFYFGNLPGDAGGPGGAVNAADVIAVRNNTGTASNTPVTDPHDFNRDGRVNSNDLAVARINAGRTLATLTSAGSGAAPAAPEVTTRVAPTARGGYRPQRVWEDQPPNLLA